jgi:hypothetical protein
MLRSSEVLFPSKQKLIRMTKHKIHDLILLVVVVLGGIFVAITWRLQSGLQTEYDRLALLTGELPVQDSSKVHVKAIDTHNPLHFAWRIYLPPKYRLIVKDSCGGQSNSSRSDSCDFVARVRFRENEQGLLSLYTSFQGTSGMMSIGDKALTELLRDNWERIEVEQLGKNDPVTLASNEPALLLQLTLPEDLKNEAQGKVSDRVKQRHVPVLFALELRPPNPNP